MLAKQLVPNKFWIVQDRGRKVGTLQKDTNCYYFITKLEKIKFDNMDEIYKTFGENFLEQTVKNKIQTDLYAKEVYGYSIPKP